MLDPEIRQFLYDYIESIKTIRRNGEEIIKERTSNGKYNRVGDILDCVISEFYFVISDSNELFTSFCNASISKCVVYIRSFRTS